MFESLVEEIEGIKTHKFHLIEGPASPDLREVISKAVLPLPPSYTNFVLRFGNAKLYRRTNYYLIEIYAGPREAATPSGEPLIGFGRTHSSLAYFKTSLLVEGGESPVFEWRHDEGLRKTAEGFEEWLASQCSAARRQYSEKEWKALENGPPPFTEQEKAIVKARKQFRWRVAGIGSNGNLQFEVHNESNLTLPYLSIGIRGKLRPPKTGPLIGAVYLPVSSIGPGETKAIEHDCYKRLITPEDTEAFELPDPEPEDRDRYREFQAPRKSTDQRERE